MQKSGVAEVPKVTEPTTIVIFGVTGALAARKLLPSLMRLVREGALPGNFVLVGIAREISGDFSSYVFDTIMQTADCDEAAARKVADAAHFVPGDATKDDWVEPLQSLLKERAESHVVYYLSTAPSLFAPIVQTLESSDLKSAGKNVSLVVEKPFGYDLASARKLDQIIDHCFDEHQVYRMDHYLGKDTVQNILALRFQNGLFEPSWNMAYIDHVQITLAESGGIGSRGRYYEESGALRDVVQNHLLQLLANIAMEPPASMSADDLRAARAAALKEIVSITDKELSDVVRGQYVAGTDFYGHDAEGYTDEEHVAADSDVETYVALPVRLSSSRWRGVPFYLRAGKRLERDVTEITLQFRPSPHRLYEGKETANLLTIRIQPNEGIALRLAIKEPGFQATLEEVDMSFCYRDTFEGRLPEAYDRLLLDCFLRDQSLFAHKDEIEASWAFVDDLRTRWKDLPVHEYAVGTWGPKAADALMERAGRRWWGNILDVCAVPGMGQATEVTKEQ